LSGTPEVVDDDRERQRRGVDRESEDC